jgi:DNA gyrase subunit A
VTNIKVTGKNGKVAAISHVIEGDQILLITEQGMMIRTSVGDIRSMGRSTQGVRIINIDEGDMVVAAVKVVEKEGASEEEAIEATDENPPETPEDDTVH